MQTNLASKELGFRLISTATMALGLVPGNFLFNLILDYSKQYLHLLDDPKWFYWLALIPLAITILSVFFVIYQYYIDKRNYYNSAQFGPKRLMWFFLGGVALAFAIRSSVVTLSWFLFASGK